MTTPYYSHAGITIFHADCLGISLPAADLLLADPPYGINFIHGGNDDNRSFFGEQTIILGWIPARLRNGEDLRGRFKERRANGEQLFDCTDEHLEGIAYSLTSQCQIQWSLDRPWEVE